MEVLLSPSTHESLILDAPSEGRVCTDRALAVRARAVVVQEGERALASRSSKGAPPNAFQGAAPRTAVVMARATAGVKSSERS